jgi:hypothetical protein
MPVIQLLEEERWSKVIIQISIINLISFDQSYKIIPNSRLKNSHVHITLQYLRHRTLQKIIIFCQVDSRSKVECRMPRSILYSYHINIDGSIHCTYENFLKLGLIEKVSHFDKNNINYGRM